MPVGTPVSSFYKAVHKAKLLQLVFVFPMVMPVSATVVMVHSFLQGVQPDMAQLILLFIWKNVGYNMILLLAGLAMIPREYYESSRLDGASGWKNFQHITLPLLLPMLFLAFLVSVLDIFKSFGTFFFLEETIRRKHLHDTEFREQQFSKFEFSEIMYCHDVYLYCCVYHDRSCLWNLSHHSKKIRLKDIWLKGFCFFLPCCFYFLYCGFCFIPLCRRMR